MKDIKNIIMIIAIICIGTLTIGGIIAADKNKTEASILNSIPNYDRNANGISIIRVSRCKYVAWESQYGNQLVHYAGCQNSEHE